jgi:hypothetical protein
VRAILDETYCKEVVYQEISPSYETEEEDKKQIKKFTYPPTLTSYYTRLTCANKFEGLGKENGCFIPRENSFPIQNLNVELNNQGKLNFPDLSGKVQVLLRRSLFLKTGIFFSIT